MQRTTSRSQTQRFAAKLARQILRSGPGRKATVLALSGDLGAGKTTFTQGFIKALGVKHRVTSPTFLLVRRYEVESPKSKVKGSGNSSTYNLQPITYKDAYHFDLYRIHAVKELAPLHFGKILRDPRNIVLLEWPERVRKAIPRSAKWIFFEHGRNQKERNIKMRK
ncbi:MAG: tRNA (adenosine(37)-N6)-threonylcarbamoyltransferase complex ATPase subunit type 1 TsaE [Patescibacteria group bacterium]|nr:tRNA (adenosine(37)-N6)-threonylcarbamoyltransferase complex ATPase subunit type 1 TsaE [Patescibacteria group bacterium]